MQWSSSVFSVFHQDQAGELHEWKDNDGWKVTPFVEKDCFHGTNIAVVHTKDMRRAVIFFQDSEGYVCCRFVTCLFLFRVNNLLYRVSVANNGIWNTDKTRIAKAMKGTGIGAIEFNGMYKLRNPGMS